MARILTCHLGDSACHPTASNGIPRVASDLDEIRVARAVLEASFNPDGAPTMTMKTLSTDDLSCVTGGTATASNTSSSNDQLLTTLQTIQSSLSDLGKNSNNCPLQNNTLLFMTMAMALQRRSEVVVYGGRPYGWRVW